jgi:hypothetical protein
MAMHLKELRNVDLERIRLVRKMVHYQALVDKTMDVIHFP